MKTITWKYYILIPFLAGALSFCTKNQAEDKFYQPVTDIGKKVYAASEVYRIYTDTTFVIAPGVEETDVHFQCMSGFIVRAWIIKAELGTPGLQLRVSVPDDVKELHKTRQTLPEMAEVYDAPGGRVAAMVNGDFWDTGTIIPRGPLHLQGLILNQVFNYSERVPQQALSYVAVKNDGTVFIDFKDSYYDNQESLKEVTGAGVVLVKDGVVPVIPSGWTARDPRTAIGYDRDGNCVYILVADGRQNFWSYGLTYAEMSSIFVALGCVEAANLDGGGSSQLLIRHPVARTWMIRNSPSDGAERPVFNGWMITVDEP